MIETTTQAAGSEPAAVTIAPGWAPTILTPRGTAALRLAEFGDVWDELSPEDRAWFAPWINHLLIDAVLSGVSDGRR